LVGAVVEVRVDEVQLLRHERGVLVVLPVATQLLLGTLLTSVPPRLLQWGQAVRVDLLKRWIPQTVMRVLMEGNPLWALLYLQEEGLGALVERRERA
jgi:hypothetical protein